MDFTALFFNLIDYLFRVALCGVPPMMCRWVLLRTFLPPDLDGSEPYDQWVHRFVGYFPAGVLAVALLALTDTVKPSVVRLIVRALRVIFNN